MMGSAVVQLVKRLLPQFEDQALNLDRLWHFSFSFRSTGADVINKF